MEGVSFTKYSLKIGNVIVVMSSGRYVFYRNMHGNDEMSVIEDYISYLRKNNEMSLANAVEKMVGAGSVGGVFSDKNIIGIMDCGGRLYEINGVDCDGEGFLNAYYFKKQLNVGGGLGVEVQDDCKRNA